MNSSNCCRNGIENGCPSGLLLLGVYFLDDLAEEVVLAAQVVDLLLQSLLPRFYAELAAHRAVQFVGTDLSSQVRVL